jgi:hypothetical protein
MMVFMVSLETSVKKLRRIRIAKLEETANARSLRVKQRANISLFPEWSLATSLII